MFKFIETIYCPRPGFVVSWVCLSRVCLCTDPLIFELEVLQDDLNRGKNSKMSVKYVSIKLRLGNNQSSEDRSFSEIGRSENGRCTDDGNFMNTVRFKCNF
jgi:hypothetical protein